jgi:hypothetical protein
MKQELRPSIVFSTMPVFDMLRQQLHMANYRVIQFIDAKVSVRLWFLVISTTALIAIVSWTVSMTSCTTYAFSQLFFNSKFK